MLYLLIVWGHYVLRSCLVVSVHTTSVVDGLVVAWRLKVIFLFLVMFESVKSWVCHMVREIVIGRSVLLDQLQILQLDGVVVLPRHLVVHLVRIIGYVPLLFDLHVDSSVESLLVVRLTKDMLLDINQLFFTFLPPFLIFTSTRSDPSPPVQSLEPGYHSRQHLPLSVLQVVQFHTVTVLKHLMAGVIWILLIYVHNWML